MVPPLVDPAPTAAPLHPQPSLPGPAAAATARSGAAQGSVPAASPVTGTPAPETLHPALWLGHQLGRSGGLVLASGFDVLDAQLPGGGWPRRALTELLLPHPGVGEMRLLAPSLATVQRDGRLVMLFDPPAALSAWALRHLGLDLELLLVIHSRVRAAAHARGGADSLWAFEQALKSGQVGALLAWLPPRLRAERLRRLQLAAHAHDGAAFVLRELAAEARPSAAPLRLALSASGADTLALRLLKRRGPPLETPLRIALPPVLAGPARQRAAAGMATPATLHEATFVDLA